MKTVNKLLSVILCSLVLASSFVSCAESNPNETSGVETQPSAESIETQPEETELTDGLPDSNFNGYSFRIYASSMYDKPCAHYITYDELSGDPVNDVLFESKCYIEDRFNVGVSWQEVGYSTEACDEAKTAIVGGIDAFDLFIGHDGGTVGLGTQGYALNLLEIPQFDFDKPWWPKNTVEALTIGNQMYAASSYLSYCGLHWTRALTINKDYAEEIGLEIPYNAVREGKWTLDALETIVNGVSIDVDGNGKINAKDKIGLTSGNHTMYCMQEACGVSFYTKDQDGYPQLSIDLERADKYVTLMRELFSGTDYIHSGDFGVAVFNEGTALFAFTQVGDAYDTYRLGEVRYGFLPSPKLDENQSEYVNCCTDVPWMLPITLGDDQINKVGTIVEAMSCYNYKNVIPAYYEGAIKARIADSPDDTEMLQLIADTRTISFAYTYGMTYSNIAENLLVGRREPASEIAKSEKSAKKNLEKFLETYISMAQ